MTKTQKNAMKYVKRLLAGKGEVSFKMGGKHGKLFIVMNGTSRMLTVPNTPSDEFRCFQALGGQVRRAMKEMAA